MEKWILAATLALISAVLVPQSARAEALAAQQTSACISISEENAQNPNSRYGDYLVWVVTNNCTAPYAVSFCAQNNNDLNVGTCGVGSGGGGIFVRAGPPSIPGIILPGQSIEYAHAMPQYESAYSICVARRAASGRYEPGPTCPRTSAGIHAAWAAEALQSSGWRVHPAYPPQSNVWTR